MNLSFCKASRLVALRALKRSYERLPRNIKVLALGWLVWSPAQAMAGPYTQLYLSALGADPERISAVQSAHNAANAVARLVGGYYADKQGRKKLIWQGTVFVALTYVAMAAAASWPVYAAASIANGFALYYQPALESIQADSVGMLMRGRTYALLSFLSGALTSVAPAAGAALVSTFGLTDGVRIAFAVSALTGFAIAAARYAWLEETLSQAGTRESIVRAYIEALRETKREVKSILSVDLALNFVGGLTVLSTYYVFYHLGLDAAYVGFLSAASGLAGLAANIPAGQVVDRKGRGYAIQLGLHLGTLSLLLFVLTPPKSSMTLALLLVSSLLGSVGGPFYGLAYSALRADLVPEKTRGRVYALLGLPPAAAWSVGALAGGWLYSAVGPQAPFVASLALRVALTPLLIAVVRNLTRSVDSVIVAANGSR